MKEVNKKYSVPDGNNKVSKSSTIVREA